ncbi:MAG: hypothetical protein ACREMD_07065 [Gemmatimonadota bacterium]
MRIVLKVALAAMTFGVLAIPPVVFAQQSGVRAGAERADDGDRAPAMSRDARMHGMMNTMDTMHGMMGMMHECMEMGMMQECMEMMNERKEKMDAMPDTSMMQPAFHESDAGLRPSGGTDHCKHPREKLETRPMRGAGSGPVDTGGDDEGSRGRDQ